MGQVKNFRKWRPGYCLITESEDVIPIKYLQLYEIAHRGNKEEVQRMQALQFTTNEVDKVLYRVMLTGYSKK